MMILDGERLKCQIVGIVLQCTSVQLSDAGRRITVLTWRASHTASLG